jgi:hypothetical protein
VLKTNSLILDFLFHNIKPNVNVLDSLDFLIIVSIKYCWLIITFQLTGLSMLSTTFRPGTNFFSRIAYRVAL